MISSEDEADENGIKTSSEDYIFPIHLHLLIRILFLDTEQTYIPLSLCALLGYTRTDNSLQANDRVATRGNS